MPRKTVTFLLICILSIVFGYFVASSHSVQILAAIAFILLVGVTLFDARYIIVLWVLLANPLWLFWQDNISARLTIHAATAALLLLALLFHWIVKKQFVKPRLWEFCWPLFALVSILLATREQSLVRDEFFLFKNLLVPYTFYIFAKELFDREKSFKLFAWAFMALSLILAFLGFYEYQTGDLIWHKLELGQMLKVPMAFGPYADAVRYGFMQAIAYFMAYYLFLNTKPNKRSNSYLRAGLLILMLIFASSVFLSSERSVILAFLIVAGISMFRLLKGRSKKLVLIIIAFCMLSLAAILAVLDNQVIDEKLNLSDHSVNVRVAQYISAIEIFADYPLTGIGYAYFDNGDKVQTYRVTYNGASSVGSNIHSSPLDILATGGLLSLLPYILFFAGLFFALLKGLKTTRANNPKLNNPRLNNPRLNNLVFSVLMILVMQILIDQTVAEVYSEMLNTTLLFIYGSTLAMLQSNTIEQ